MPRLHDAIINWDMWVWRAINTQGHNAFLDEVLPFLRNQFFWAPIYLFLLCFTLYNFGKKGALWCLFFLLTFALSDQVSAHLIKPLVHRLRPCNTPSLQSIIHLLVECGSGYSFPSSHSANHFAISTFIIGTMGKMSKWILPICLLWALAVSYSQVYVGVHFPIDVICGGCIGAIIGLTTAWVFDRYFNLTISLKTSNFNNEQFYS